MVSERGTQLAVKMSGCWSMATKKFVYCGRSKLQRPSWFARGTLLVRPFSMMHGRSMKQMKSKSIHSHILLSLWWRDYEYSFRGSYLCSETWFWFRLCPHALLLCWFVIDLTFARSSPRAEPNSDILIFPLRSVSDLSIYFYLYIYLCEIADRCSIEEFADGEQHTWPIKWPKDLVRIESQSDIIANESIELTNETTRREKKEQKNLS
jgi:hypothetical protein